MMIIQAKAKINLTLDVLGKRPDGYHELSTIMQSINLCDTLTFKKTEKKGISLKINNPLLPTDEKNLIYRIAHFLILEYNIRQGVSIDLIKRIPIAAGLAGGSTNAAATLFALNKLFELNISPPQLYKIGQRFGADIPFCMLGGTALAEGIGEKLKPLASHPKAWLVLVRPQVLVSTQEIFSRWQPQMAKPKSSAMITALESGDIRQVASKLSNDLAPIAMALYPQISRVMNVLQEQNALGVNMSGSGPTVFAYFDAETAAHEAIDSLNRSIGKLDSFCIKINDSK